MNKLLSIFIVLLLLSACPFAHRRYGASVDGPTHITVGQVMPAYDQVWQNWQNAGLATQGGLAAVIAARTTICATVNPSGKTPPTGGDDAALINAAITACPAGQVLMLAPGTFQIDQSEYIALNKGITIRGSGSPVASCSANCWPTTINVYNGALADWAISATTTGANCGVTPASHSTCTMSVGVILASPSTNFNWGWAGCFLNTTPTGCGSVVAADVAQGATTVQVASTSKFSVGMAALIDENPATVSTLNPTGGSAIQASPEFLSNSGTPAVMRMTGGDDNSPYSFAPNRVNQEIHIIKAIGPGPCPGTNCTLTFDDPLTLAFRQSGGHDSRTYWPTVQGAANNPFLQFAGVENLTITKAPSGGVEAQFCAYCWVYHVEVGGWLYGAVDLNYTIRNQVEGNYFHDCYDCENNGAEYPIGVTSASTEDYIVNNIIVRGGKGMVGRASNTTVVAYNYVDDTFYMQASIGDYWMDMSLNGSHYVGTHHWLFEGNWADNGDGDETHGNALYHTYFRNQLTGVRTPFVDPSNNKTVSDGTLSCWSNTGASATCAPLRAAGPMAFNYWYAYVGNVLGLAGVTTSAKGWVYQGAFCGGNICTGGFVQNRAIWMSGWAGGEWPSTDPHLTTTTNPYIFRHGNYDYVTASIADWTAGFSQSLPPSLYLAVAPAFFSAGLTCTYPWPWVTPTAVPQVQPNSCGGSGLPAKARFDAGTPFVQP